MVRPTEANEPSRKSQLLIDTLETEYRSLQFFFREYLLDAAGSCAED